jgi:hypothetical protein
MMMTRMRMRMRMIFYGGTGTKCTENQILGTRNATTMTTMTTMPSAEGQGDRPRGRIEMLRMTPSATGTLDRKTSQASSLTCLYYDRTKRSENDDNKIMTRPMEYSHDHDKQQLRYDAALVVAAPTGSDRTRMMKDVCATLMETNNGHGDLHQGRMEDDEDGGTPMLSATGTLDRKTGQATPMRQSATGSTLDRKTDQAPPTTCHQ